MYLFAFLAGLLWAPLVYAADGDQLGCEVGESKYEFCQAYYLCDEKSGNGSCGEFDLAEDAIGIPDSIQFSFEDVSDCVGVPDVEIFAANESRTCTAGSAVCHTLTNLSSTVTSQFIGGTDVAVPRYISADISNLTSCSDLEVVMHLYYHRVGND